MTEFDPELYLRRLGEREVIMADEDHPSRWQSQVQDAASALVSCGVISAGRAAPLVSGYATAIDLRASPGGHRSRLVFAVPRGDGSDPRPLTPRRETGTGAEVLIEELHPDNLALAWLWQTLADFSDTTGGTSGFPAALSALQAAGLIPAEHPQLEALNWVRDRALPPEQSGDRSAPAPAAVPEEWRRFRTGRTGAFSGPSRTVEIGVSTPVFGGVRVAVDALSSERFGFSLQAEAIGATLEHHEPAVLGRNPLVWWARDDNHNVYLGHASSWSGPGDGRGPGRGDVEFAALDPSASELTVIAQTARARALIRFAL